MTNSRLRFFLNLDTLDRLPETSIWKEFQGREREERLLSDGFEGVQQTGADPVPADTRLSWCGCGRINTPADADPLAAQHAGLGHECLTVHAGWGLEDDDVVDRIVEAILQASARHRLPIYIETHRATLTQDMWRTVKLTERFPEIRFNGDFSHYYTGQEMKYGDFEAKLDFLQPVFDRVRFLHGRIGNPCCMQVPIGDGRGRPPQATGEVDFLAQFRQLWTRAFEGFLRNAAPGEHLVFCPEILSETHYYARVFPNTHGQMTEESDRYAEALAYNRIAGECFTNALNRMNPSHDAETL